MAHDQTVVCSKNGADCESLIFNKHVHMIDVSHSITVCIDNFVFQIEARQRGCPIKKVNLMILLVFS